MMEIVQEPSNSEILVCQQVSPLQMWKAVAIWDYYFVCVWYFRVSVYILNQLTDFYESVCEEFVMEGHLCALFS
jgi:hypothetical protein